MIKIQEKIRMLNEETLSSLSLKNEDEEGLTKSFLLFNESEKICVNSEEEFLNNLNKITNDSYVKCVSIFGNTGWFSLSKILLI